MHDPPEEVTIRLARHEAIVLDALLHRHERYSRAEDTVVLEDPSEHAALWGLSAALERVLSESLRGDYDSLLAAARRRVRRESGV